MKIGFERRSFVLAVFLVMAAILVILATLQYRWSTKVSEATEARLGGNLQTLALDWHMDFFHLFSEIAIALQVGPDSGAHDDAHDFLERYSNWQRNSSDSAAVSSVFIWETSRAGEPQLWQLIPKDQKISPFPAPADLQPLLARLRQSSATLPAALSAWRSPDLGSSEPSRAAPSGDRSDPITGWMFDPVIPAFVHPIIHHRLPREAITPVSASVIDWIVVRFDLSVIRTQALPELTAKYFSGPEGLDYHVTLVADGHPPQVIYSSDPQSESLDISSADVVMEIFGSPPETTEEHIVPALRHAVSLHGGNWQNFVGPIWFPLIREPGKNVSWSLFLRHRQGSLEEVIATARRRDLAISFGVLFLLGITMTVLIIATQRAQRLAELQMNFVTTVSHELRTPLAVIGSAAENIADGVVDGKEQLKHYGQVINAQSRQLTRLVEQILLFASTRQSRPSYYLRALEVPDIVDAALSNTAELVRQSQFTVERDIQPNLPQVIGDLAALSQVLQNLIINAIKYSGNSRWIRIHAYVTADPKGKSEVQISVEDRGIGIEEAELRHVFEPFYRASAATAAQIHGTGLGLPLSRSIAEDMGGQLTLSSKSGAGSKFVLHLPLSGDSGLSANVVLNSTVTQKS